MINFKVQSTNRNFANGFKQVFITLEGTSKNLSFDHLILYPSPKGEGQAEFLEVPLSICKTMERQSAFLVSKYFGKWLVSRKGAVELLRKGRSFDTNQNNKSIHINFTGVNFISRSFAHQFLKCVDKYNTNVIIVNPNSSITKLLEATRKNYKSQRKESGISYPRYTVKDRHEYFEKLGIE